MNIKKKSPKCQKIEYFKLLFKIILKMSKMNEIFLKFFVKNKKFEKKLQVL